MPYQLQRSPLRLDVTDELLLEAIELLEAMDELLVMEELLTADELLELAMELLTELLTALLLEDETTPAESPYSRPRPLVPKYSRP